MSNATQKQPTVIYLYKEDRCPKCLYLNPKGEKHFACHNSIPDRNNRTNPECPAGEYIIVAGFRVELWAQRYAKAQLSGHLKNIRAIQTKLEGLDEETVQSFWNQVNINVAIAMGASVTEEVDDAEDGLTGDGPADAVVEPDDGVVEPDAPVQDQDGEDADADPVGQVAPAANAEADDEWED